MWEERRTVDEVSTATRAGTAIACQVISTQKRKSDLHRKILLIALVSVYLGLFEGLRLTAGPMLAYIGPMWPHVEPSWELCWGHVWAIYVEKILRCQFFRSWPPPGAQNHVKTEVL
jgi:hypothetical protein